MGHRKTVVTLLFTACVAWPACATDTGGGRGGGALTLRQGADVFYGNAFTATAPAVFDYDRVKEKTAEWHTIQRDDVSEGSARYQLLIEQMRKDLRKRVRTAARKRNRDLVVRKGDITDDGGFDVVDLTDDLVGR